MVPVCLSRLASIAANRRARIDPGGVVLGLRYLVIWRITLQAVVPQQSC